MPDFIFEFTSPDDEPVSQRVSIDDPSFTQRLIMASRTKEAISACLNCGGYYDENVIISGIHTVH